MDNTDLNSPVKNSILIKQLGIIPADVCACVSVGAKCLKVFPDPESIEKNDEVQESFLLVFEVSFGTHDFKLCKLAITGAVLSVELQNNYVAADAAPKIEKDMQSIRVHYTYGVRKESANKYNYNLSYKLSDGNGLSALADNSKSKSESYETVYETEATFEYCTVQYRNPLSSKPEWVFERNQNQRVLKDIRAVWLAVEKPKGSTPVSGKATLSAKFKLVYEKEKIIDKLTENQIRIYDTVMFGAFRKLLLSKELMRDAVISFKDLN